MNVQDAHGERIAESGSQQSHEAGQADQIYFATLELGNQGLVVLFARDSFRRNAQRGQATLTGDFQAARFGAIGNYNRDPGVQTSRGYAVRDGFEIRSASRKQDADPLHRLPPL